MSRDQVHVELFGERHRARRRSNRRSQRVGVVGAGIVGCSIAYQLARAGAEIVIFEQERPAAGASGHSFAWLNATFDKQPRAYFELNHLGMLGYRELERELAGLQIQWGGGVEWTADQREGAQLREQVARHREWSYSTRSIESSELFELVPGLEPGAVAAAAFSAEEGSLDAVAATSTLLEAALAAGATLECPAEVVAIDQRGGVLRSITTRRDEVALDALVIAAGIDTARVASLVGIDVPLIESPGVLALSEPMPRVLNRVVLAPTAHMCQRPDGRVVTGRDFGGGPVATNQDLSDLGRRLLVEAARYLPALQGTALERATTGWRPMPADGLPAVGHTTEVEGLYVAVTHSGVTLAPILGLCAAYEILDGLELDLLARFRPARFQS